MDWQTTTWNDTFRIVLSTIGVYIVVIAIIRANGLRSLSKMSSFDFVMSIAVGSIVTSTLLSKSTSLAEGAIGLATLFLCQRLLAWAQKNAGASVLVDNNELIISKSTLIYRDSLLHFYNYCA